MLYSFILFYLQNKAKFKKQFINFGDVICVETRSLLKLQLLVLFNIMIK